MSDLESRDLHQLLSQKISSSFPQLSDLEVDVATRAIINKVLYGVNYEPEFEEYLSSIEENLREMV